MSKVDYIGLVVVKSGDLEQAGVKGMRWGIRNDKSKSTTGSETPKAKTGPESSAQRYDRLLVQAKKNGANTFSEEDLRFVTQRGNALSQVDRLNASKPNWVADAAKQALKQAATQTVKTVVANSAKKYINSQLGK